MSTTSPITYSSNHLIILNIFLLIKVEELLHDLIIKIEKLLINNILILIISFILYR